MLPLDNNCPDCVVCFGANLIRLDAVMSLRFQYLGDISLPSVQYAVLVKYEYDQKETSYVGSRTDIFHFLEQLFDIEYMSRMSIPKTVEFVDSLKDRNRDIEGEINKAKSTFNISKKDFDDLMQKTNEEAEKERSEKQEAKKKSKPKKPTSAKKKPAPRKKKQDSEEK